MFSGFPFRDCLSYVLTISDDLLCNDFFAGYHSAWFAGLESCAELRWVGRFSTTRTCTLINSPSQEFMAEVDYSLDWSCKPIFRRLKSIVCDPFHLRTEISLPKTRPYLNTQDSSFGTGTFHTDLYKSANDHDQFSISRRDVIFLVSYDNG